MTKPTGASERQADHVTRQERPPGAPRRLSRTTHQAIALFVLVQLCLPLRGFVLDLHQTRGDFSWNMYSHRYQCRARYAERDSTGKVERIDYREHFQRRSRAPMVFHRDALPAFHASLCSVVAPAERGRELIASVRCSINNGPRQPLVAEGVDICSAPRYAVLER